MSKSLKIILFAVIGFVGMLILIVAALYFVDTGVYKSRLERAASESLGLDIRVGGRLGIAFFGDLHVRLDDVHIRNREMDIASAEQASLEIALFPLLHNEFRIKRIGLQRPRITITRDRDGTFNFEKRKKSKKTRLTLALDKLFISDGFFLYGDDQSGKGLEVEHFNLDVRSVGIAGGNSAELLKKIPLTAEFACREIRTKGLTISHAKFTCRGKDGIFALTPVTMGLFGGQGSGSIGVDFTGPVPRYSVRLSLSNFRIEEYLKTLSSKKVAQGLMDCSASLSMRGNTAKELKQTAAGNVSLRGENLVFSYGDDQSGKRPAVRNFNLDVRSLRIAGGTSQELLKNLSFTAELACREIRTKGLTISHAKFTCRGKDGIFALTPVTMGLFGGQGSGSIGVDFTDPVPRYSVRLSLSKFRIEEYLKTFFSKKVAEGSMDCSATLSMRGNTAKELKQTAGGEVTLRGENLTLYGHDLDREFARFESSQNFKLVDAGAFFFAGPLGLAVTKGYNFASIFQGSGGSSSIGKLSSSWKVERGIAQAKDVAMATTKNRIALKGRINFVDERFDDVIIALIDARGCARVQQKIRGPFRKPVVEKPNVLMSLAGPALNLFKQARDLFTGEKCKAFYTGSIRVPQ